MPSTDLHATASLSEQTMSDKTREGTLPGLLLDGV